jgi:hypothetical protein
MTSNVLQHRHFDLRQTINFAVEPINNDDLDGEWLRWRGWDDCWHYPAQFHVFLSAGGKLFPLEPSVHALPDPCNSDHKDAEGMGAIPHTNVIHFYAVHAAISDCR